MSTKHKHGHARKNNRTPEYKIWSAIKSRCHNPNHAAYKYYGARGIYVCERWRNDFSSFYADMGPRPDKATIERIDNSKGYEPGNCAWATRRQQSRNTRKNRFFQMNGKTLCMQDWTNKYGISAFDLRYRLVCKGMRLEDAIKDLGGNLE